MPTFNVKVSDNSVQIKYDQVKNGWGSATAPDLFLTIVESLKMIISQYTETCEVILDYTKTGKEDIKDLAKTGHYESGSCIYWCMLPWLATTAS